MVREIGSEFWDIPTKSQNNDLFNDFSWFVSGRAALRAILRQIPIDTGLSSISLALPSYLCSSLIEPLEKENINYCFYSVKILNGSLKYDFSSVLDCNVILIMDYFGYESAQIDPLIKNKIIIRDLTHSIFIKKYDDSDYCFGSLRKWAGYICGGFAYSRFGKIIASGTQPTKYIELRKMAMFHKAQYISRKTNNKQHLRFFRDAEVFLDECDISPCYIDDVEAAKKLDVDFLKKTRRANARLIIRELTDYCLFTQLGQNDCPLCVPIIYKKRDELRDYLISLNIYCPIHWPKPKQLHNQMSQELYDNEISIVCDQRYSEQDMKRIIEAIKSFMEKNNNALCSNA